jgi:biopolymer transport protein TolR
VAHLSRRKLRVEEAEEAGELNIVPYLDILMNLIIFMLLSMAGLATFGALNVSARGERAVPGGEDETPPVTLTVAVAKTGFFITAPGVLQGQPIPRTAQGRYDYDSLSAKMQELKSAFPSASRVIIAAEADTDYEALVATLDATRETADRKVLFPDVTLATF